MSSFDDLGILRRIDELETQAGAPLYMDGLRLLYEVRPAQQLDHERDPKLFAHELVLAKRDGFLGFDDSPSYLMPGADPYTQSFQWLQQLRDISLTTAGRDRARGRVVFIPPPDPDEDDGRMIASLTLDEVAHSIADTYGPSQVHTFLVDSGVPAAPMQGQLADDGSAYAKAMLARLLNEGSAGRRTLRHFLGAWLSDHLQTSPPDDVRRRILDGLGRQGWHVNQAGVLVIGERTAAKPTRLAPLDRENRIASLHPGIRAFADRYLEKDTPEVAIFEALKAINNRVQQMTGLDLDGAALMHATMKEEAPTIHFAADSSSPTGKNVQGGLHFIFAGAMRALRNPDAHEQLRLRTEAEAFEELHFASMLMRRLDQATVRNA